MANEKKIVKKDWVSNFTLVGKAKVDDRYTFKIDQHSEKSNWIFNSMNLGVDCGEKSGVIYCEMMGGYSADSDSKIYAHGKDENGNDDFDKQIIVDWEDRLDEDVLNEIGDLSFITVGLEKDNNGNTVYKKFLSAYDAIAYAKEHLTEGTVLNVKGNLKYSLYNGSTQVRKNITSIALSSADDVSKYHATFNQSILIDRDSASLKNIDKDKGVMYVNARVLDYLKEIDGVEVKGQYPFEKQFEFELDLSNEKLCKTIFEKLFKVKKGVTQINFQGDLIEGGALTTITLDDMPDDIKDLVVCGIYTEEEAIAQCADKRSKERRMVLRKPRIKLVGDEDNKTPVVQKFDERYEEEDLIIDLPSTNNQVEESDEDTESISGDSDMDWLNAL